MIIENVIGKPVWGNNFFGRQTELDELRKLSEGEHVLLLAPRRVGKTSLLHALAASVNEDGSAIGAYASVAAATNEGQFVQALLDGIYATKHGRRLKPSWVKRALHARHRVKNVKVAGSGFDLDPRTASWQSDADAAFSTVLKSDRPVLFLIDELPVLVLSLAKEDPSGARVRAFLQWFRNLRQRTDAADKLRFVLAGSIGLDSVTRRHRLSDTINDLRLWPLGPFDSDAADAFIGRLAESYSLALGPEIRGAICSAAEWLIPYHLQVIFSELRCHANATAPSVAMVGAVVEQLLERRIYFSYWEERLHDSLGAPHDEFARTLLAACAQSPEGATRDVMLLRLPVAEGPDRANTFSWIVDVLANDGYLVRQGERWRFRSGLLRRYWLRHVA